MPLILSMPATWLLENMFVSWTLDLFWIHAKLQASVS